VAGDLTVERTIAEVVDILHDYSFVGVEAQYMAGSIHLSQNVVALKIVRVNALRYVYARLTYVWFRVIARLVWAFELGSVNESWSCCELEGRLRHVAGGEAAKAV
jgi:hypothetical protein